MGCVREELRVLTESFREKLEKLEGRLFDIEAMSKRMEAELKEVKKTKPGTAEQHPASAPGGRIKAGKREQTDLQQYSRRWNLRVYKVPEPDTKTAEDCAKTVCQIFSDCVGVRPTAEEVEVAHGAGQRSSVNPRPVLVRFFGRRKRDRILSQCRNLTGKKYVIGEDLTYSNYQLSRRANEHPATESVWSPNGKILARMNNGLIIRLNIHSNLNEAFRRATSSPWLR